MKYQGGKARIAKRLVETMTTLAPDKTRWVEPFVGGAWVLEAAHKSGQFTEYRISDALEDVILLYQAVAEGWEPPTEVSRELHHSLKKAPPSALRAAVGFGSSFGGVFLTGYCGDHMNGTATNAQIAARHLVRRRELFAMSHPLHRDYRESAVDVGPDTLLYLDPPYAATIGYKGTDAFDSDTFWQWAHAMAGKGAAVFVSEYSAPAGVEMVWSRTAKQTAAQRTNHSVTDSLYHVLPSDYIAHEGEA